MISSNARKSIHPSIHGRLGLLLAFCFTAVIAVNPLSTSASEADELATTVGKELRSAERLMFNGKKEEADRMLEAAAAMIEELRATDPDHKKLASIESTYRRIRTTLDKRLGKTTKASSDRPLPPKPSASAPAAPKPPAAQAAATQEPPAKLPGGVSKRLRDIAGALDHTESALAEGRTDNARYQLQKVPDLFGEIDRMYGGQFSPDHPDFVAAQTRYREVEAAVEAGAEAEAQAAADAEKAAEAAEGDAARWVERFAPYISGSYLPAGHEPEKELIFPGTAYPEKIAAMQAVYEEAKAVYADYEQNGPDPSDIPWELEQAANDLRYALESYESSSQSAMSGYYQDAESNLDQALSQLARTEWKDDPEAVPPLIGKDWRERIDALIENLETVLPSGDPKLLELKEKHAQVLQQDAEHRAIWQQRVRVRPEIYDGDDLAEIRSKAESIVTEDQPGAEILRISVYQDAWDEESVIESTDTTNTAVRHRVTRMINAQVAAKVGDEVLLHTLHIAKDRQSDGGWGKLYGHIMSSDRMLEENVGT